MRTEKERVEEFARKFHDKDVRIRYVLGAFGDMEDCVGIVEEEVFPKEGGSFIKYLGCSYLQKGCPLGVIPMELIECYGLAKRILVRASTDIVRDKLLMFYVFTYWLFKRKKFYKLLDRYAADICHKTLYVLKFDKKRYNKFPKELRRTLREVFIKEVGQESFDKIEKLLSTSYNGDDKKLSFYLTLYRLMELIIFLVDFDTAYKFPVQDAFAEIKDNDPIKELERLIDILIERSQGEFKEKVKQIKKVIPYLKYFPPAKRMLKTFFQELNVEEIRMDETDWYWCLRRRLYNFKGMSLEDRLEEAKKIDKEKGHIKIKFNIAFSEEEYYRKLGVEPPKNLDSNKEKV